MIANRYMESAKKAAEEVFGFQRLRPFQEDVLEAVFQRNDVFAVAATASGKSALYGLPSLVLPGTVVVVSPLIALMKDQQHKLESCGIPSCRLTGDQTPMQVRNLLSRLNEYNVVFTSPERAATKEFRAALRKVQEVSMFALDEAHSTASLYANFRGAAAHLVDVLNDHPTAVRLACTATADPYIEADVIRVFQLRSPKRFISSPWRENITWDFQEDASERDLLDLVQHHHERPGAQIVYVASRSSTLEVATLLKTRGIEAEHYHAGMTASARTAVQERFTSGVSRCIVATSAFGMGIDVPNIRLVANWHLPATLFDLAQCVGRASRDGAPALGWTRLGSKAEKPQRYFLMMSNPAYSVYERLHAAFAQHGPVSRWTMDVLGKVSGCGEKFRGQLDSALSYLEFRGNIKTTAAGVVYRLPILNRALAQRLCASMRGAKIDGDNVRYETTHGQEDQHDIFIKHRACAKQEPEAAYLVKVLTKDLNITPEEVKLKKDRAEDQIEHMYMFAQAENKKHYLESVMLQHTQRNGDAPIQ